MAEGKRYLIIMFPVTKVIECLANEETFYYLPTAQEKQNAKIAYELCPEGIATGCRGCQASCTFVATKVTCRKLRFGALNPLFRPTKVHG